MQLTKLTHTATSFQKKIKGIEFIMKEGFASFISSKPIIDISQIPIFGIESNSYKATEIVESRPTKIPFNSYKYWTKVKVKAC